MSEPAETDVNQTSAAAIAGVAAQSGGAGSMPSRVRERAGERQGQATRQADADAGPAQSLAGVDAGLAQAPMALQHAILRQLNTGVPIGEGVRRGAKWSTASRIATQFVQFLGTVASARLLLPADYGKAAIIFPVIGFAALFTSLGLSSAVVHARLLTEELLSTAFWLNAISGLLLAGVVCGISFPLSALFHQPVVAPLLCLASLNLGLDLSVIHLALLSRTLQFRQVALRETGSAIVTTGVLVVSAALGAGPFSFVYGSVAGTVYTTVTAWSLVRWLPKAKPDRGSLNELWNYSKGITGYQVLNFWSANADNLLLARFASQAAVGGYLRAYSLMGLPVSQMQAMMGRVLFPAMSRLRDDRQRLARSWIRALSMAASLTAPVCVGTAVSAPALLDVLYGPRWTSIATVLELLAVGAFPAVLSSTVPAVLRAAGATGRLFRLGMITSSLAILAIIAGLPGGVIGVSTALAAASYLQLLIVARPALRETGLQGAELLRVLGPIVVACGALAAVGLAIRLELHASAWVVFPAQVIFCALAYVGTLALIDRGRLEELWLLLRNRTAGAAREVPLT